jgi:hypothetical protein
MNWLMLFTGTVAVYSENHMNPINTPHKQYVQIISLLVDFPTAVHK